MRYTLSDVAVRPSRAAEWWIDLALRRNIRRFAWWRWLLLEPGQGWLRWETATAWTAGSYLEPPEPYGIAPPLRRLWWVIRYRERWPLAMRDEDRRLHRAW